MESEAGCFYLFYIDFLGGAGATKKYTGQLKLETWLPTGLELSGKFVLNTEYLVNLKLLKKQLHCCLNFIFFLRDTTQCCHITFWFRAKSMMSLNQNRKKKYLED